MKLTKTPKNLIVEDAPPLTVDSLKGAMPKRQKHNITPSLVKSLNTIVADAEERDYFRNNLVSYTSILNDPNITLNNYIHAVKYVSFQLMGHNNQESWIKTFPDRYQRCLDTNKNAGHIRATVSCYNANKIVNMVREQALIPTYVLNADMFQDALNTQAKLMADPTVSNKVRSDAANSLLTHLKQPETTKLKIEIGVDNNDTIKDLRDAAMELARVQRLNIESGAMTALEVAESKVIEGHSERIGD